MDATCAIQASIHVFSLVRKYVSRILGTYHPAACYSQNPPPAHKTDQSVVTVHPDRYSDCFQ